MVKKVILSIVLLALAIGFKSCQKDPKLLDETSLTPYIIQTKAGFPPLRLPSNNPLTEEGVLLGRMLFYDPLLSLDSTISCNSCHFQNRAFAQSTRFSKGIRGQLSPRNSMPLFNLMWQNRFFWDGRALSLSEQILIPIQAHDEMDMNFYDLSIRLKKSERYAPLFKKVFNTSEISPVEITKALEQFMVSIVSFNSKIDQLFGRTDTLNVIDASALRGLNLFMKPVEDGGADCFHCHSNIPFFGNTSLNGSMANNGLSSVFTDKGLGRITGKPTDEGKFKIPSLRNVELTAPYMHDGRFATLEDVIDFYSDGMNFDSPNLDINISAHDAQLNLSQQEKEDLIAFLKSLTDTEFINNPKYKNPF
jgi:cytochrome c peroxidase